MQHCGTTMSAGRNCWMLCSNVVRGRRCTAEEADQRGQLAVTAAAVVREALAAAPAGRASGPPDGIRAESYDMYTMSKIMHKCQRAEALTAVREGNGLPGEVSS